MAFYTCVNRYGSNILYRGYTSDGEPVKKKVKFEPTLFVQSDKNESSWKSLYGHNVEPVQFESMKEAQEFVKKYSEVDNFRIFGNTNYVAQYIQETFPNDIHLDITKVDIGTIDIEVLAEDGFPEADKANYPIVSICYKSSRKGVFRVWSLVDFDSSNHSLELGKSVINHVKCKDEASLINSFLLWWVDNTPDILTGWFSRLFDIPYIINRTIKILGEEEAKRLSPWRIIRYREIRMKFKAMDSYDIYGVQQIDYMDLFQKFGYAYGPQESYTLDHIAYTVVNARKLSYEEHGSLHSLYKNDPQKFIEYNIRDVQLVEKIDAESKLMELCLMLALKGGVNFSDAFGTTGIWDSFIYRYLTPKKIAIPFSTFKRKTEYPGGYVKSPRVGMSDWIVSFDLASLYPNLIVQYNMSPETVMNGIVEPNGVDYFLENVPQKGDYAIAANGVSFRKDFRGMMPNIIINLYNDRRRIKDEMLEIKREKEKTGNKSLDTKIKQMNNSQQAIKILMNSLYGAMGSAYFRYFDLRLAEGITLSGQLTIRWAENEINRYMRDKFDKDKDYVIAMDTDSLYVDMSDLVNQFKPKSPVDFLDKACKEVFEKVFEKSYNRLFEQMNGYDNRMVLEREVIANRGLWTGKKHYILNVLDSEGVRYAEPQLKIQGLEAVKSSTPFFIRNGLKKAFKIILNESEEELQKFVREFYEEFKTLPAEEVSFPKGLTELEKWIDPLIQFKKGCPIHVRGAILYNNLLISKGIHNRFESIKPGAKVKYCYLKMPNPIGQNVIAFSQFLPKEFELDEYIDYETQYAKTFREPLKLVINPLNWNLDKTATLKRFFK